jgi:hypothetical protein
MPKTNRQKEREGILDVKEENPREVNIATIDDILNDVEKGRKISAKRPPSNGRVPECLTSGCKETKAMNFYMSFNPIHAKYGVYPFCKNCMAKFFDRFYEIWGNREVALFYTCQKFDIGFEKTLIQSAKDSKYHMFAGYMSQYNSKMNRSDFATSFTFCKENLLKLEDVKRDEFDMQRQYDFETLKWSKEDRDNKEDVMSTYGYDVFEDYEMDDKKKMYNILVDYLDEATKADNFKKSAVVQIVKNMQYIDKIDKDMLHLDIINNSKDFKDLTSAKNSLMKSNLDMAKDNGISLNNSTNKSKGAGTLSGILKDLQEKKIVESDVNIFDIKTLGGIKKVADISNRSILDQIMLDENSYTEMIKEQRDLIEKYRIEAESAKEELRLLKIEKANGK